VNKARQTGFTTIELVTVLAIIAMLVAILLPAVTAVRSMAVQARQQAQFTAIGAALTAFRNDYGDYPPSFSGRITGTGWVPSDDFYCGAQKLCEALLGWDLMGFHPDSDFRANGRKLPPASTFIYDATDPDQMAKRKDRYLELQSTTAFQLGPAGGRQGLYNVTGDLAPNTFVLCDVFGIKRITMPNGAAVKTGSPILYYRANRSGQTIQERYRASDNWPLLVLGRITDGAAHPLYSTTPTDVFYEQITDWKLPTVNRADPTTRYPHRPDSYILISAGPDGLYGTGDDITNFDN